MEEAWPSSSSPIASSPSSLHRHLRPPYSAMSPFSSPPKRQDGIHARAERAGVETMTADHGYCKSLYITDPNGLLLEFTVDHPDVAKIDAIRRESAHRDLARWLVGRPHEQQRLASGLLKIEPSSDLNLLSENPVCTYQI